jgi:SAM-dependent methyltransferase
MTPSAARPAWWLDELAHAGPEHLDAEYVSHYTSKAGFDPSDDIDALVALGLDGESTVVDLGAGTGTFTVAAAAVAGRVVAADVSPPMVATLRATVAQRGLDNVSVRSAGLLSYVHEGAPPAFVYSRNVLHQVPDFWKAVALARIHDLLPVGGVLRLRDLVYDFEPDDAAAALGRWFAGAVEDPAHGWTAGELAEHVRAEHSTFTWLLEPMLDHAGFEVVDRTTSRGAYAAYTCRRR